MKSAGILLVMLGLCVFLAGFMGMVGNSEVPPEMPPMHVGLTVSGMMMMLVGFVIVS